MSRPTVVIASDHPDMSTGFARISELMARALAEGGDRSVHYLATRFSGEAGERRPFHLHPIGPGPGEPVERGPFIEAVRTSLSEEGKGKPTPMILVDAVNEQEILLGYLVEAGLRERLRILSYLPVDFSPPAQKFLSLARKVDVVVPYSEFGRRALLAGLGHHPGTSKWISKPIPHGVDTRVFCPPGPQERREVRQRVFSAADDDLVIGFFSRNTERKRTDLVLLLFFLWSTGCFGTCPVDGEVTAGKLDPVDLSATPPRQCRYCGSTEILPGTPSLNSRLYLHTELLEPRERQTVMGWDIPTIVRSLGLGKRVITVPELRPGEGLPRKELIRRMGSCDVHLLPFMGGGWELTALETGACGVPNILTDFAAPREYARPFSLMVPPETFRLRRYGVEGIMDLHKGVRALETLASSPAMRETLGREGVKVAGRFDLSHVGQHWAALVRKVSA